MHKALRLLLVGICFFGFLFIRFRESILFYDPLIDYYHGDYQNNPIPYIAEGKLYANILLRFVMNMVLSITILWLVFRDKQIIKFSTLFYGVVFILLIITMFILVRTYDFKTYLPLFYVRRFLIQPILLFLLVPAFFYHRKVNN